MQKHIENPIKHQDGFFTKIVNSLKAVSTTFLLVCFVCLKERTCETKKNVFYFTLKSLYVLLNFQIFKCHGVIKCLSMKTETHFVEQFGKQTQPVNEIWPAYVTLQDNFFITKFYGKCGLETSSRPFLIFKESSVKRNLRRPACWFRPISIALLLHIWYK